jgi:hypothetical protein
MGMGILFWKEVKIIYKSEMTDNSMGSTGPSLF